jgi:hypothetical protein
MSKFKETIKSPHIHISLATGISIIVLAYFSKRILPEPIGYLSLAIPPFLMTIWEALFSKDKYKKICKTWYWITAIFIATALVIVLHAV